MNKDNIDLFQLKGHIKVELFNAESGALEQCEEGDNLITDYGTQQFKRDMLKGLIVLSGDPNFSIALIGAQYNTQYNTRYQTIQNLWLSDSDAVPSSAGRQFPGNLTGKAMVPEYSGGDALQGSINRAECEFDLDHLKIVMDFATDRANGIHKSVFLSNMASPLVFNGVMALTELKLKTPSGVQCSIFNILDGGTHYYVIFEASGNKVYKYLKSDFSLVQTITLPRSMYNGHKALAYHNEHLYYTNDNVNLYKYSIASNTEVATIAPSYFQYAANYSWAVHSNYLYYTHSNFGSLTLARVNLTTFAYGSAVGMDGINGLLVHGTTLAAYVNRQIKEVNPTTGAFGAVLEDLALPGGTTLNIGVNGQLNPFPSPENAGCHSLAYVDGRWFMYLLGTSYYLNSSDTFTQSISGALYTVDITKIRSNILTHKKLDTPITKTSAQTMKVTYTLTFA